MIRNLTLWTALTLFIIPTLQGQTLHYVRQSASGGAQNGSNWANAFVDLQQALTAAQAGDIIWVAAGTYKPTSTTNRHKSFQLVSGVKMYGGFGGTETSLDQRDAGKNETILSGNIGNASVPTDNSYHVLLGEGLDEHSTLDGFTVTGGYSYGEALPFPFSDYEMGAGLLLLPGANLPDSRPLIANCRFVNNHANNGGGLFAGSTSLVAPDQSNTVNPVLRDCTFEYNRAYYSGGAMYKNGPTPAPDTFTVERCRFAHNTAVDGGGGGLLFHFGFNSVHRLRHCLFEQDTTVTHLGGGVYFGMQHFDHRFATLLLDSCVFRKNLAPSVAGLGFESFTSESKGAALNCVMRGCTFEANRSRTDVAPAFLIWSQQEGKVNVEMTDCKVLNNMALTGEMACTIAALGNSEGHVNIDRCEFVGNIQGPGNSSDAYCAGLNVGTDGATQSKITSRISNCLFANNQGGILAASGDQCQVQTDVINCTFYNNYRYIFVKSWYKQFNQVNHPYYNYMNIRNCILWEPKAYTSSYFFNNDYDNIIYVKTIGFQVDYSMTDLFGTEAISAGDYVFGDSMIFNHPFFGYNYPHFMDSIQGDFRLKPCSPMRSRGSNAYVSGLTDLDGLPRIRYGRVDLGAYERQDSCATVSDAPPQVTIQPLRIWPNPSADGTLCLMLPPEAAVLRVFDGEGKEVVQQSIPSGTPAYYSVHLRDVSTGVYQVMLETDSGVWSGKWVKI